MKKLLLIIGLAALLAGISQAQTNTPTPPTVNGLISTFGNWVGSYDTNLTFDDVIIWDGPIYQNHVNIGNEFGISYDVWRQTISTNNTSLASVGNKLGGQMFLAPEARFRQASIAGDLLSEGGGIEFGWMKYDFRAGLFGDLVYLDHPGAVGRLHTCRARAAYSPRRCFPRPARLACSSLYRPARSSRSSERI